MTQVDRVTLPRSVVIDRMIKDINGGDLLASNENRYGHMDRERATEVLECFKAAWSVPFDRDWNKMEKDVSVSTGLTYYDLRAPALNLFPTVTPLRNAIARTSRPGGRGDAAHWKTILATNGSGYSHMGWVPEGQRSGSMSYNSTPGVATYVTLGEEDSITEEARAAAEGFEDEDALVQLRLLLKMFVKEETGILAGNSSLVLSTPGTIVSSASGSGATLPGAPTTYSAYVVALTQEGYLNSSLTGGVATSMIITGNDGKTYTLNGGSSDKSAAKTQAVSLGQTLFLSVPVVNGAVAYAWYVGTSGNEKLEAITLINSVAFSAPLAGTHQAISAIAGDHSRNQTYAFDGLMTTAYAAGSNAYVKVMATGTAGTGTGLTASGAGGVVEIDQMLRSMWDNYRISPTVIYVNAQELKNITLKVLTNSSGPLLRYNVAVDQQGLAEYKLTAAGVISFYFNPFTADGGIRIPVKIHPDLAPGTIIAWAEKLPPWYVSNETPNVAEMLTRRDYYNKVWAETTRAQYYGVYCQEVLAVYAPFAMGIITNIADA